MKNCLRYLALVGIVAAVPALAVAQTVPQVIEAPYGGAKINPIDDPPPPTTTLPPHEDPDEPDEPEIERPCVTTVSIIPITGTGPNGSNLSINASGDVPACLLDMLNGIAAECCAPGAACPQDGGGGTRCENGQVAEGYCDDCVADRIHSHYYDAQCNPAYVDNPAQARVCGNVDVSYLTSPVSLIWAKGHDIETELSFSQFPLDPAKTGRSYVWKASEKAPLVVYDPEHRGEITSAFQLFGDWTFGGKKLASLDTGSLPKTKWENGYEALKSLDENRDGALSGRELQPLGLWFDKNRDGVSQKGEVTAMLQAGVTKIFVTPDRTDPLSGSVHASAGFERMEHGKLIRGASVDWYARSASTPAELISGILAKSQLCSTPESSEAVIQPVEQPMPYGAIKKSSVTGMWKWKTTAAKSGAIGGYITFAEAADGTITGHSYYAYSMTGPKAPALGIGKYSLKGKRTGEQTIEFTVQGKQESQTVQTIAKLSPEGKLVGISSANVVVDGKPSRFIYEWEGEQMGIRK